MVENTDSTRQLKTKMNLNKYRKTKWRTINTTYTQDWNQTGWHQWFDLRIHHADQQIKSQIPKHYFHFVCWAQNRALKWNCPPYFPLWQTLEPILALREVQYTNNLAAQSQNLFPLCSEPWAQRLFNFPRYQVNHACLCNMICKKQAVKLRLLENKQHPTISTLRLSLPPPGNCSLPSS